jgi:hypothetical protein
MEHQDWPSPTAITGELLECGDQVAELSTFADRIGLKPQVYAA